MNRLSYVQTLAALGLFLVCPLDSADIAPVTVPVAASGRALAAIVVGVSAGESTTFAVAQLKKYLRALSGAQIPVITDRQIASRPAGEAWILVGAPDQNRAVKEAVNAGLTGFNGLGADGFALKTCLLEKRLVAVAGGADEAATMYAVFELARQLGVTFRLTGDIVPEPQSSLSIPPLNLRKEPALLRRGFLLEASHHPSITMLSYADYVRLIDQMAKMKYNYLQFWWFPYEPWLKYSYKGETKLIGDMSTKETGYMNTMYDGFGSRTTDDVVVGKQRFPRRRLAAPEFEHVETPEQAFAAAQDLLRRVIRYAKRRNVKMWLVDEMSALPPNLARYCERIGELPFSKVFGALVNPLDPVNREIQVIRLKALIDTYPEAEGYFLNFSEVYFPINNARHGDFYRRQAASFQDLNKLLAPWIDWQHVGRPAMIDSNIGYFDLFNYLLSKRNEIAPHAKLGLMTVGRGYVMPLFDKMVPKDIPFTTFDSGGRCGWTPNGMPMSYFGGMEPRERVVSPYIDDDCEMMGLQFNTAVYSGKDRIFTDGVKHGLGGVAGWMSRIRGTEPNSGFIAEAAWEPELTPEKFYREYSERLFAAAAAPDMYRAFMTLEENEAYLSRDLRPAASTMGCCGPGQEASIARRYSMQDNPFDGPKEPDWRAYIKRSPAFIAQFEGSIPLLGKALVSLRAAQSKVAPRGKYELAYLINRTETYRDNMRAHITVRKGFVAFDQAFQDRSHLSHEQFVEVLESSLRQIDDAHRQVEALTAKYAEMTDSSADLEVLYHLNVRTLLAFDISRQWLRQIVNFHEGKPYWGHVPFERLFPGMIRVGKGIEGQM